jgi:hypothetical protein
VLFQRLKSSVHMRLLDASYRLRTMSSIHRDAEQATPSQAEIINDLKTEGVHVTTADRLLSESAQRAIASAAAFIRDPSTRGNVGLWRIGASSHDISANTLLRELPGVYSLGLEPTLLSLVQQYIRQPVAYHGAVIRRSLVDGRDAGTRLWHQDGEDFHVFRMVIYLNDVEPGGGPFEYIPRTTGLTYSRFADPAAPLTNDRMKEVIPFEQWRRVTGLSGTVVLADTAKTFHHESMQTERERSVIMIGYSSQHPKCMATAMDHFPVESLRSELLRTVPPENHGHVFDWRRRAT